MRRGPKAGNPFHYYFTEVSGDFDAVVQNTGGENVGSWTKGGPIVRESLDAVNTADGTENNLFDHVSASWSVDE